MLKNILGCVSVTYYPLDYPSHVADLENELSRDYTLLTRVARFSTLGAQEINDFTNLRVSVLSWVFLFCKDGLFTWFLPVTCGFYM